MQRGRDESHDIEMMEDASDAKKCKVSAATSATKHSPTPSKSHAPNKRNAYYQHITPGVYSPPDSLYSHVPIPESCVPLVHMIMGHKGAHFKNITSISGAKYIWFNNEKNVIEVWGPMRCHERASRLLYGHMNACFERAKKRDAKKQACTQSTPESVDSTDEWKIRMLPTKEDMDMDMDPEEDEDATETDSPK